MEAAAPGEPTTEPVASALAQAITGTDGDKKKKKKKKKKKLSAKAKRLVGSNLTIYHINYLKSNSSN
jgi:hypothetical protein